MHRNNSFKKRKLMLINLVRYKRSEEEEVNIVSVFNLVRYERSEEEEANIVSVLC